VAQPGGSADSNLDPVMVILTFDTDRPDDLYAVLARYVVVSRSQPGCRNIDLVASATRPGRVAVVEKWDSRPAQQAHFDSQDMVTMAQACDGLLTGPPDIDLYEGISMHDLA
jgi:quinol monooxygenase YgiN